MITTDKEAFEYVIEMLLEQGEKSLDQDETCQYRGHRQETINNAYREMKKDYPYADDEFDIDFIQYLKSIPTDAKCAVGYLISDNFYDSSIEGDGLNYEVYQIVQRSHPNWIPEDLNVEGDSSWKLLNDLQKIHDTVPVSEWEASFTLIAERFDLHGNYIKGE